MTLNSLSDTLSSPNWTVELKRIQEVQDLALEAWTVACNSRVLRRALVENARPIQREYVTGELVFYWRPATQTRGPTWRGPAVVVSALVGGGYLLDHAGSGVRAKGVRGAQDIGYGVTPVDAADVVIAHAEIEAVEERPEEPVVPAVVVASDVVPAPAPVCEALCDAPVCDESEAPVPFVDYGDESVPGEPVEAGAVELVAADLAVPVAETVALEPKGELVPVPVVREYPKVPVLSWLEQGSAIVREGNAPVARAVESSSVVEYDDMVRSVPRPVVAGLKCNKCEWKKRNPDKPLSAYKKAHCAECPLAKRGPMAALVCSCVALCEECVREDASAVVSSVGPVADVEAVSDACAGGPGPKLTVPGCPEAASEDGIRRGGPSAVVEQIETEYDADWTLQVACVKPTPVTAVPERFCGRTCACAVALHERFYRHVALLSEAEISVETRGARSSLAAQLSSTDSYSFQWDDLSEDMQIKSRDAGIEDYLKWQCLGEECSHGELYRLHPSATFLRAHWVDRAQIKNGELRGKSRWTPHGFLEWWIAGEDTESPTASVVTQRAVEVVRQSRGWSIRTIDVQTGFFQSDAMSPSKIVFLLLPPELQGGRKGPDALLRRLLKEVPGTRTAPRAFYDKLHRVLTEVLGMSRSKVDSSLWWMVDAKLGRVTGYVVTHVDDARCGGEEEFLQVLCKQLPQELVLGTIEDAHTVDYTGRTIASSADGSRISQPAYVREKLHEVELPAQFVRTPWQPLSSQDESPEIRKVYADFRSALGAAMWLSQTRFERLYAISRAGSAVTNLTVKDVQDLNKVIRYYQHTADAVHFLPACRESGGALRVVGICDASEATVERPRAYGSYAVCLAPRERTDLSGELAAVEVRAHPIKRVATSSFDAEVLEAHSCLDACISLSYLLEESESGPRPSLVDRKVLPGWRPQLPPIDMFSDNQGLVSAARSLKENNALQRRRRIDISDFRESLSLGVLRSITHIQGCVNPLDIGTKAVSDSGLNFRLFIQLVQEGKLDFDSVRGTARSLCAWSAYRDPQDMWDRAACSGGVVEAMAGDLPWYLEPWFALCDEWEE